MRLDLHHGAAVGHGDQGGAEALVVYAPGQVHVRAQAYLERCLEQRPDDPAVLNNIAQCRLRKGDPKGALPYIERAKGILPDSPEIKRTYERVKAALAEEGR